MKQSGITIGAALIASMFALGLGASANAASNAKDEAAIKSDEQKIMDASNADEVMKYYDGKNIVFFDFVPPAEYKGAKAVHADLDNFFNNASDVKGEFLDIGVVTDGKMGVAYSVQHFTWKGKDGKAQEGNFRVTDVYRKEGGVWKVIHSHVSVPVDPATGKPDMAAKVS
ncbi:MAG TPA: nuclear transport factor 2 family protein [Candidatus Binataceae bacterium]|nr:nuclear transport factor 2 family protein [Candidatus Binataceae bacterium]